MQPISVGWVWTDGTSSGGGQVPSASRYRVGYCVTDIIRPVVWLTLGLEAMRWLGSLFTSR